MSHTPAILTDTLLQVWILLSNLKESNFHTHRKFQPGSQSPGLGQLEGCHLPHWSLGDTASACSSKSSQGPLPTLRWKGSRAETTSAADVP